MDRWGWNVGGVEFDFGVSEEDGPHGSGAEGTMAGDTAEEVDDLVPQGARGGERPGVLYDRVLVRITVLVVSMLLVLKSMRVSTIQGRVCGLW